MRQYEVLVKVERYEIYLVEAESPEEAATRWPLEGVYVETLPDPGPCSVDDVILVEQE